MLREDEESTLSGEGQRYLDVIEDASRRMAELIDDLLALSRMARVEMLETQVDLDQLLYETLAGMEMDLRGRDIVWTISPLPRVRGDTSMLRQVLVNLLRNAVKYPRPRKPARIEIGRAANEAGRVVLFVRDNGVGFDMGSAGKLFGVFQRLHRADEFEGTGIGLANVRQIIARHGGRVWAQASPDQGATFYLTLAAASEEESGE
jgi:signal transduction histidine kinase